MKTSKYSEEKIIGFIHEQESGIPVQELCRRHSFAPATFYKWRAKFGGMDVSMIKRLKELEEENQRLKKMHAEECLKSLIRQEALEGKLLSYVSVKRWHKVP